MLEKALTKIFGSKHDREMKSLRPLINRVNELENSIKALSDVDLKSQSSKFQERINNGESLDDILPEAFATCREAAWRVLGMRHYDVQLIGGMILHQGNIAEMRTGEGKTLVATLPVYLNGLSGKGAHVVTVNDYLATRDAEWMGQLYNWLGLSVGTIIHGKNDQQRKDSYGADITYGTNNEFGFDYLRDNMKFSLDNYVQRELNFAIVDECDSILVDEARTPLIISGPKDDSTDKYHEVNKIIPHLRMDVHFTMEEKSKTATLTEEGNAKVEQLLGVQNLFDPENIDLLHHIYQGLKAHHLFKKDVDYMVKDGEVVIVDEFTGRLMDGRRWSDGLHQAVEAKEGVSVKNENQTLATITFQNYFRMYNKLAGMTGTAETEAEEFKKIYDLDVSVIPTNKPIARKDHEDVVYKTEPAKFRAIAKDIEERKESGQPVLVGTVSIQRSEKLSRLLRDAGITHNVLNAKHHEREAEIVSQAGRKGSVTIATNMAGRGTDIVLGGNPEFMARAELPDDATEEKIMEVAEKYKPICEAEKAGVLEAGGLYIIGTERHESRRIDNQLRGRSGRQGDPGESRFFLSLEDDLMRIFNGERIQKIMDRLNVPEDEPIMAGMVSRAIEGAQRKVEGHQFDIRKHLLEYDDVMNQQRTAVYDMRKQVLSGENLERIVLDDLGEVTSFILDQFANEAVKVQDWDLDGMNVALNQQFGLHIEFPQKNELNFEKITELVSTAVKKIYDTKKQYWGDIYDFFVNDRLLATIDSKWKEHLEYIDKMKEGINLRAYAQKDPLVEYKKEAFSAFENMIHSIKTHFLMEYFKLEVSDSYRQFLMQTRRDEFDDSAFEYDGADDSEISGAVQVPMQQELDGGPAPSNLPFANPQAAAQAQRQQQMHRGDNGQQGQGLNRAERRKQKKKKKR
ncbi:MAG: preprotein translocase subunit SecA [Bdellovibrionales bacterium]|nr:preprotein translocase subunit SecA [Bdellovibrionales bacterium]